MHYIVPKVYMEHIRGKHCKIYIDCTVCIVCNRHIVLFEYSDSGRPRQRFHTYRRLSKGPPGYWPLTREDAVLRADVTMPTQSSFLVAGASRDDNSTNSTASWPTEFREILRRI